LSHEDKGQQGNQKRERDKLIRQGKTPKEASRLAKLKFPLPGSQSKRKNRQPKGGAEPGESDRDDGSGRQSGAFGRGW
jgi:hypothetical protein